VVSELGFFSGTSFLLSTSRALKWPAKTIVEKATMKKPMAAAAVCFKKTSNIPGTGAMVSKLGFFSGTSFLLSTTRSLSQALSLLQQELLHSTIMACKDDCWEGDYEEAKEQNGCRSSSLCDCKHSPNDAFLKPMPK
jgi:hypothetical protein